MKTLRRMGLLMVLLLIPAAASAQGFRDLDSALGSLNRGFERGDANAVVAGIVAGDQVMLQFPGLTQQSGFFGRDQAAYLLEELFQRANPSGFEQISAKKNSAEGQYNITARWTINLSGQQEQRELYITLRSRDDRWSIATIRTAGR